MLGHCVVCAADDGCSCTEQGDEFKMVHDISWLINCRGLDVNGIFAKIFNPVGREFHYVFKKVQNRTICRGVYQNAIPMPAFSHDVFLYGFMMYESWRGMLTFPKSRL